MVFVFGMVLPPTALLWWAVKSKRVRDWDVSDRKQRIPVLLVTLLFLSIDLLLIRFVGNAALESLLVVFIIWFVGFFAITLRWKISGHVGITTVGSVLLVLWFGASWWPIFLTIPLVAWSRIAMGKHTLNEVIGGLVYSILFFSFLLYFKIQY